MKKAKKSGVKETLKRVWRFIWEDDSLASWLVNIVLAFVLVKFIIYPGLGLLFGTNYPVVAVVSGSMTHGQQDFETWWEMNQEWYTAKGFTKEEFQNFPFANGFDQGDIMVLLGSKPQNVKLGQVIVYESHPDYPPIIHRVISKSEDESKVYFETKGDNNIIADREKIAQERFLGKAVLRIPYLGWVKIMFTTAISKIIGIL
ncbi:signal peptidase I [Candidatus Woesearchaeota archaeon]|nr:signal peptidase I [Candidatus Woesearchaeota archaeon]